MTKEELIQDFLKQNKVETKVLVFTESTRTSQNAADQAGCELARIAKSIVFKAGDEPVLVITSGPNKVSEEKIEKALKENHSDVLESIGTENPRMEKADAEFVYGKTGFPIGGVPAFCHKTKMKFVFIDEDLVKFEKVWSAAGTPHAIFEISTEDLIRLSGAKVADIKL